MEDSSRAGSARKVEDESRVGSLTDGSLSKGAPDKKRRVKRTARRMVETADISGAIRPSHSVSCVSMPLIMRSI